MKIFSFSLMMSLTLTLLTVGIVTAITTIPTQTAEAEEKAYCPPFPTREKCSVADLEKKECESISGKGECEKTKFESVE